MQIANSNMHMSNPRNGASTDSAINKGPIIPLNPQKIPTELDLIKMYDNYTYMQVDVNNLKQFLSTIIDNKYLPTATRATSITGMLFENAIINHDKDPGMENHSSEFRRPK